MTGGVYIDDTGTPGVTSKSRYLHQERKSWAAVIIQPKVEGPLQGAMKIFLDGIQSDYGANELHFTDIYSGRGPYKNVGIQQRFKLLDLMALMFEKFDLPIIYQTSSPKSLDELRQRHKFPSGNVGWFSLANHEHFGLFALCSQTADFIREHRAYFPDKVPLVIDEGLAKKGSSIPLPAFQDVFEDGELKFHATEDCVYLQLADFAAFVIGRTQWLLAKGSLKEHDRRFLNIISPRRLNVINLAAFQCDIDEISTEFYDELMQEDRLFKGFKDP